MQLTRLNIGCASPAVRQGPVRSVTRFVTTRTLLEGDAESAQASGALGQRARVSNVRNAGKRSLIADFLKYQSAAADVQAARDKAAATKRRQRANRESRMTTAPPTRRGTTQ